MDDILATGIWAPNHRGGENRPRAGARFSLCGGRLGAGREVHVGVYCTAVFADWLVMLLVQVRPFL
jgi:hypothetical protein